MSRMRDEVGGDSLDQEDELSNLVPCPVCKKGLGEMALKGSMKQNYQNYKEEWTVLKRKNLEAEWAGRKLKEADSVIVVAATCGDLFHKTCLMKYCSTNFKNVKGPKRKRPHCPKCKQVIMYSLHREIEFDSHRQTKTTKFERNYWKTESMNKELNGQLIRSSSILEQLLQKIDAAKSQLENARELQTGLSKRLPDSVEEIRFRIEIMRRRKQEKEDMEDYIEKAQAVIELMHQETPNVMRMYLREVQKRAVEDIPKCTPIPRMLIPYLDKISGDELCLFALSQVLRPRSYPGSIKVTRDTHLTAILNRVSPSLLKKLRLQTKELNCDLQNAYETLFPKSSLRVLETLREIRKSSEQSVEDSSSEGSNLAVTIMYVLDEGDNGSLNMRPIEYKDNVVLIDKDNNQVSKRSTNLKMIRRPQTVPSPCHFRVKKQRASGFKMSTVLSKIRPTDFRASFLPSKSTENRGGSGENEVLEDATLNLKIDEVDANPPREMELETLVKGRMFEEASEVVISGVGVSEVNVNPVMNSIIPSITEPVKVDQFSEPLTSNAKSVEEDDQNVCKQGVEFRDENKNDINNLILIPNIDENKNVQYLVANVSTSEGIVVIKRPVVNVDEKDGYLAINMDSRRDVIECPTKQAGSDAPKDKVNAIHDYDYPSGSEVEFPDCHKSDNESNYENTDDEEVIDEDDNEEVIDEDDNEEVVDEYENEEAVDEYDNEEVVDEYENEEAVDEYDNDEAVDEYGNEDLVEDDNEKVDEDDDEELDDGELNSGNIGTYELKSFLLATANPKNNSSAKRSTSLNTSSMTVARHDSLLVLAAAESQIQLSQSMTSFGDKPHRSDDQSHRQLVEHDSEDEVDHQTSQSDSLSAECLRFLASNPSPTFMRSSSKPSISSNSIVNPPHRTAIGSHSSTTAKVSNLATTKASKSLSNGRTATYRLKTRPPTVQPENKVPATPTPSTPVLCNLFRGENDNFGQLYKASMDFLLKGPTFPVTIQVPQNGQIVSPCFELHDNPYLLQKPTLANPRQQSTSKCRIIRQDQNSPNHHSQACYNQNCRNMHLPTNPSSTCRIDVPQAHSTILSNAELGRNVKVKQSQIRRVKTSVPPPIQTKLIIECETPHQKPGHTRSQNSSIIRANSPPPYISDPVKVKGLGVQIAKLAMTLAPPPTTRSNKLLTAVDSLTMLKILKSESKVKNDGDGSLRSNSKSRSNTGVANLGSGTRATELIGKPVKKFKRLLTPRRVNGVTDIEEGRDSSGRQQLTPTANFVIGRAPPVDHGLARDHKSSRSGRARPGTWKKKLLSGMTVKLD